LRGENEKAGFLTTVIPSAVSLTTSDAKIDRAGELVERATPTHRAHFFHQSHHQKQIH